MSCRRLSRGSMVLMVLLAISACGAGLSPNPVWQKQDQVPPGKIASVRPQVFKGFKLNHSALRDLLARVPREGKSAAPMEIQLPMPDGTLARFKVFESPIMAPALAAKFPALKTFAGKGVDDPAATLRLDYTPAGLHAQILSPHGAVFVEPYWKDDTNFYATYFKSDYKKTADGFQCLTPSETSQAATPSAASPQGFQLGDNQLRTYRLACAATAEYVTFQSAPNPPNVSDGMAAIVTAINRVNGIYETELAIRLILVGNNDQLVFTDTNSEPYQDANPVMMLGENQATVDSIIGDTNYDVGHVLSTGPGGVAMIAVAGRSGYKAEGVSGQPAPVGDGFYVDYVAHEIGHEFGAHHPFNSQMAACGNGQRFRDTAYEPGSGSTIMAYAGICGSDDLQAHSAPYFHSVNLQEIIQYTTMGGGSSCPVTTPTGDHSPSVNCPTNFIIPAGTPFTLTATGSDPDDDTVTFCWEERDLGPPQELDDPDNGRSPLFRSFSPTANPSRTFPQWSDILNSTNTLGEQLPMLPRTMNFQVTARDDYSGGGGVSFAMTQVIVATNVGPFMVSEPQEGETWFESRTVIWDPAGTTNDPIDAESVNILLSTNGGTNFSYVLATNVPNSGSAVVTMPVISTTQARIRVEAVGNIFFAVNPGNFSIIPETNPPPSLATIPDKIVHQGITLRFTNVVSAPYSPPDKFAFTLDPGAPDEAVLNSSSGVFSWAPDTSYIGSTNLITVRVTDLNDTNLTAAQSFNVTVMPPPTMQALTINDTNVVVSWSAISGYAYCLQYTTNLTSGRWINLATNAVSSGSMASNMDAFDATAARFYRVKVLR